MIKKKIFYSLILLAASFYATFYSANRGILPIDSFAFFDTGYLVSEGLHPLKDFWVTTGILVDYIQSLFFKLFGVTWSSYIMHSATFNFALSIFFFFFFYYSKLNIELSFFYSLAISLLFYPTMGTPFAYHHALFFSILSIMVLYLIIKYNYKIFWFSLPILMLLSFLCMQTPSSYVNLLIIIYLFYHFIKKRDFKNYNFFFLGIFVSIIIIFLYFYFSGVTVSNFLNQYILFPLSIGGNRILGNDGAFVTLSSKLSLKSIVGDFKFIYFTLIIFTYVLFENHRNLKKENNFEIFFIFVFFSLILIFNQLITANQIYIFCLIPILAGISNIYIMKDLKKKTLIPFVLVLIVSISGIKYFDRFAIDRKFIDLENIDLNDSFAASKINSKFSNLHWKTVHFSSNPKKELANLKLAIKEIQNDPRKIMIISHYQFFSALLDKNLNNLNRWYTYDNNSYPLENNKYSNVYKDFINKKIKDNKIETIYIIDASGKGWLKFSNFQKYLNDICFFDKTIVKDYLSSHTIISCN